MNARKLGVSVVVPVYKSSATLPELIARIDRVLRPLADYEVILVDDGSADNTWETIAQLAGQSPKVRGLRLGRNFGQHSALVAGVRAARYGRTVTLDDDLQNPPEEIPRLLDAMQLQGADVIYGVPQKTEHAFYRRLASRITRTALGSGLGVDSAPELSSYRAFHTDIRDAFSGDLGSGVSLDALLTWGSSSFGSTSVQHDPRSNGASNYTFPKLLRFAIDTTTGYSTVPLRLASLLGLAAGFLGFVVLLWAILRPMITGESVPGFPFLASIIAIFSGAQMLTLGIIGEYLARMHFRIMRKPTYVVAEETHK
ncbi:MAG: glycosyltransferase family 2 protein [Candidatus Nanopelagicales bacterium]|nr:glycosyltransferase family 2 protein [Candidatus Nanopelagicales bacterium]